ncbi:MAG: TM2 domain-containing protein [Gemmatimonadales bacterium]
MANPPSDKSRSIALVLGILLGPFGVHRFYVGKVGTGILMLMTLGGLGIWYLYDVVMIASGAFRDADGHRVVRWDPEEREERELGDEVLDELEALRHEVAELTERMDFTERLLTSRTGEPAPERREPY